MLHNNNKKRKNLTLQRKKALAHSNRKMGKGGIPIKIIKNKMEKAPFILFTSFIALIIT